MKRNFEEILNAIKMADFFNKAFTKTLSYEDARVAEDYEDKVEAAVESYLSAREAEMLPKLLAAMLEPEAVGKLRDAIKIASENP